MNFSKQQYRQIILNKLHNDINHDCDILIEQKLEQLLQIINITQQYYIGLYCNMSEEPYLNYTALCSKYLIALPKISADDMRYIAYQPMKPLVKNSLKVTEPIDNNPIIIPQIIVIPGLAFNLNGYRLGRGKGFFDKYISCHRQYLRYLIGVCYEYQITSKVDFELHDQPVNYIITEQQIIKIK